MLNNFNDAGAMVLSSKADNFFIAAFLSPVGVGIYSFYSRISQMIGHIQPLRVFDKVIQPVFFAVPLPEADRKIPAYFSLLINTGLLLQWPALAYGVAFHSEIVSVVFGGKFGDYSYLMPVILSFAAFNVVSDPLALVAQYEEKPGIMLLSKLSAVYNVVALLVLIPLMGLLGAVLATGSAGVAKNLFIWWHVRRRARWTNFRVGVSLGLLLWGAAAALCFAMKAVLPIPPLAQLVIGAVVCGAFLLVHVRTNAISASDRQIMQSVLRGPEARLFRVAGLLRPAQ
jgi:O-antigen/teichoic acid export membrane protein